MQLSSSIFKAYDIPLTKRAIETEQARRKAQGCAKAQAGNGDVESRGIHHVTLLDACAKQC